MLLTGSDGKDLILYNAVGGMRTSADGYQGRAAPCASAGRRGPVPGVRRRHVQRALAQVGPERYDQGHPGEAVATNAGPEHMLQVCLGRDAAPATTGAT